MNPFRSILAPIAVFSALAVVNLTAAAWVVHRLSVFPVLLLPCLQVAESLLLGLWLVYGNPPIAYRFLVASFLFLPMYIFPLEFLGERNIADIEVYRYSLPIGLAASVGVCLLSRVLGFSFHNATSTLESPRSQFSIRTFLSATCLIGTILAAARLVWRENIWEAPTAFLLLHEVCLPLCVALTCLPLPFLFLSRKLLAPAMAVAYVALMLAVIWPMGIDTYFEIVWRPFLKSGGIDWDTRLLVIGSSAGVSSALVLLASGTLRWWGYRLERRSTVPAVTSA